MCAIHISLFQECLVSKYLVKISSFFPSGFSCRQNELIIDTVTYKDEFFYSPLVKLCALLHCQIRTNRAYSFHVSLL